MASKLPRIASVGVRVLRSKLPDRLGNALRPHSERLRTVDVPPPIEAPTASTTLYIAPVNFAGQGRAWAEAASTLDGVEARNMQFRAANDLGFAADYAVSEDVFWRSHDWAARQKRAVRSGFTHVLVEAERALFGAAFSGYLHREVEWLRRGGVTAGAVSHGTDLRLPSRHVQLDEWSPFRHAPSDWVNGLESRARHNHKILDDLGIPVFVSTPELLLDRPGATWLPLVVDPARWRADTSVLKRDVPRVLHAPTNARVKGTRQIEPVLEQLQAEGLIEYVRVQGVPSAQMPQLYADADIVLEQFALGMYSVTAVEAMAAGRLVFAHVHDQVRDHVFEATGHDAPVQSTTPGELNARLRDVLRRRDEYRAIAASGPAFVREVHDGRLSARIMAPFLGITA